MSVTSCSIHLAPSTSKNYSRTGDPLAVLFPLLPKRVRFFHPEYTLTFENKFCFYLEISFSLYIHTYMCACVCMCVSIYLRVLFYILFTLMAVMTSFLNFFYLCLKYLPYFNCLYLPFNSFVAKIFDNMLCFHPCSILEVTSRMTKEKCQLMLSSLN